jgi:Ohr subfamily peroxiredoxin
MEKLTIDYTAVAINTGGRKGRVKTDDGLIDFEVTMPKEIGGEGGKTNPEQLFAAGYAACFGGTLGALAGIWSSCRYRSKDSTCCIFRRSSKIS